MNEKHEYAIERLGEMAKGFKASIKRFPDYHLVPKWRKNLKGIEKAIKALKADQKARGK